MNAKRISLALATLALLSTGSAFAQTVDVNAGPVGVSAGITPTTVTKTGINLLNAPLTMGTNLVNNIFNPPGPWFDLSVLGYGITLGGKKTLQVSGVPAAYIAPACTNVVSDNGMLLRTTEFGAVIPGSISVGAARPVAASVEAPKPMLHLDLFGNRLIRMGSVDPALDMRDN